MPWLDLGSAQPATAGTDTTGLNAGNLTTTLDLTAYGTRLTQFSIWHMVLENLSLGAQARIVLNARTFGYFGPATGAGREWFGNIFMRSGDTLYFLWNLASSTTPAPKLTAYLIYDPTLPGNQG